MEKELESAIQGAHRRFVPPEEVVQIESLIIKEIEQRLKEGRYSCLQCEIDAITYHSTIKAIFEGEIRRAEENSRIKILIRGLNDGKRK